MSLEWDDYDNFRIADRSVVKSRFPSSKEDIDNQMSSNYAKVEYSNTLLQGYGSPPSNNYPISEYRNPSNKSIFTKK